MRELRITSIEGRTYLFPVPVVKDRKYLIFCASKAEAEEIITQVRLKKITHPDLIGPQFIFLTFHTDRVTKIFVYKPPQV